MEKRKLSGKIIQVHNVLDYADGVSKQIIRLHKVFINLGLNAKIFVKHCDPRIGKFVSPIEECRTDAQDIVIFHYSGYSELYYEYFMDNSVRVILYHNITPHDFFPRDSELYALCKKGREQLAQIIRQFHYFIGDSQFNIDELISLGADSNKCYVWPIIVDNNNIEQNQTAAHTKQDFLFTGRISPNKAQDKLIKVFADYCRQFVNTNSKLILVGDDTQNHDYVNKVKKNIKKYNFASRVVITGKVSNAKVTSYYQQAQMYLSVSEHEGFGIPLIEAMFHDVPVLALGNTAVGEVIAGSNGLCQSFDELIAKINCIKTDKKFLQQILSQQYYIRQKYTYNAVEKSVKKFFKDILPIKTNRDKFKQLHIVLLTSEFPPFVGIGGIGTLYYNLASELLLMGHKVTVIAQSSKNQIYKRENFQLIEKTNERHIKLNVGTGLFAEKLNWSLLARDLIVDLHLNYKPVDIVDNCLWNAEALALSITKDYGIKICTRLVSPLKMVKEINQITINENDYNLMIKAEECLINNSDIVMPISNSIENTILRKYQVIKDRRWKKSYIGIAYWPSFDVNLNYGTLTGELAKLKTIPSNHKKLLFLGRLEKRKGFDIFLAALEKVFAQTDKITAIVMGRDCDNYTNSKIFKQYNGKQIIYLGELANAYKDSVISTSDIVVFPSRYESFGIVALEAFVHGKPVIGCNSGAIPEVIIDGESGLLFEPEDAQGLTDKIIELCNNEELYNKLAYHAKQRSYHFSSRNMARASCALYYTA